MKKSAFGVFTLLPLLISAWSGPAKADEVTKWNEIAGQVSFASGLANNFGVIEARIDAIVQVAVHDALNAIDRRYHPYAMNVQVASNASPEAAVATAAHDALVDQYNLLISALGLPSQQATLDAAYADSLALIPDGPAKTAGIAVGRAGAAVILAVRIGDGWDAPPFPFDFDYPEGTEPGEYRFTPPSTFAALTRWGEVTPFVLNQGSQFRPGRPYPVPSKKYAADLNEVKNLGGNGTTTPSARTPDQTEIALFWVEGSPFQFNRIARTVSAAVGLNMWENARLFGLLNLALADGYIGSWEAKYHYNYWRPITAIRLADTDGNPDTDGDPTWTPLVDTPPIPDYDSGHGVEGGAAAQVLKRFFGTDHVSFTACSTTLPAGSTCNDASPVTRSFSSFSQAAEENGLSRILVGFHFRKAVDEGIEHGRRIANRVVNHSLRPVQ